MKCKSLSQKKQKKRKIIIRYDKNKVTVQMFSGLQTYMIVQLFIDLLVAMQNAMSAFVTLLQVIMCSVHYFLFVIVCLSIHGLFSLLSLGIASILPLHSCAVSVFLSKGNWKERKTPECDDWDINGGGGVIEVLLFNGIDIYLDGGVI